MALRDIVGQQIAIRSLRNFISRDSIPNALLFHGAEGCGKATTALAFAQAVNCEKPDSGDACGACPSCHRIARGTDADVRVFAPRKTEYLKDEVIEMLDFASYTASAGGRKALIVEKADFFKEGGRMLKAIEEPSESTIIILISDTPFRMLTTIRSRAIPVPFHPLSAEDAAIVLVRMGVAVPETRLSVLHRLAEGNIAAMAKLAMDEQLAELIADAEEYFGSAMLKPTASPPAKIAEHLLGLAARFPVEKGDTSAAKTRLEVKMLLETLLMFLRRRLREQVERKTGAGEGFRNARRMEWVADTIRAIEGNATPALELEMLALRFMKTGERAVSGTA